MTYSLDQTRKNKLKTKLKTKLLTSISDFLHTYCRCLTIKMGSTSSMDQHSKF